MLKKILIISSMWALCLTAAWAQPTTTNPAPAAPGALPGPSTTVTTAPADSVTVTIILKHQQDKNLAELRRILEAQGFWEMFPPKDARVISWTLAMGLGHIIVVKIPAGSVRELNLAIQNGAWGAYESQIFLSYDYKPIWQEYIEKREEAKADREDDGN
jgi:hypothetical protein